MSTRAVKRRRNKRAAALREADRRYGPDTSETIAEFEDGWTIRRFATYTDAWREGFLMEHCLKEEKYVPAGTPPDRIQPGYSLRDEQNHPHLTIGHFPAAPHEPPLKLGGDTFHRDIGHTLTSGHGNQPPKTDYLERVEAWHQTLPYETHFWAENPVDVAAFAWKTLERLLTPAAAHP
jgi:hypothetical protein